MAEENLSWDKLDNISIPQCCPETQSVSLTTHRETCLLSLGAKRLTKDVKCPGCGHKRKETYAIRESIDLNDMRVKISCYYCTWMDILRERPTFSPLPRWKKVQWIDRIFCDGGLVGMNRYGGTWAWCGIDPSGQILLGEAGYVPGPPTRFNDPNKRFPPVVVTNNHTEQIAIVKALESMPDGWRGTVYSDSSVALIRVFEGGGTDFNLPKNLIERTRRAVGRMGKLQWRLLQDHPTEEDLRSGIGAKRGRPVSIYNVWCDWQCEAQREVYFQRFDAEGRERDAGPEVVPPSER